MICFDMFLSIFCVDVCWCGFFLDVFFGCVVINIGDVRCGVWGCVICGVCGYGKIYFFVE